MRRLLVVCDENKREKFVGRLEMALEDSLHIVDRAEDCDLVYVIGKIDPQMEEQVKSYEKKGYRIARVNENLVNQEVYDRLLRSGYKTEHSFDMDR